ncbi:2Fe-2S iron-sulfur cluster binding domain-containing protein [Bosea sp. F3-2]|uniref:2Fe-2S iron-sulfur cluster-binding protein n=1 Tax=Bosea sp. F3-2 TaxID=2599640 RepID=UPI0011EFA9AD|nr:2Fe-2S iron-sulfur cluster-binding protein [Bosea sp. F3-2]QEL25211.1 2Fe-2S iron-sulfur cluster binding domain-containing protein [Bosea sp. F3-2]
MAKQVSLVVNGKAAPVARGDSLLEAALGAGILIPHDCCTGQCETCRVRVYAGEVDAQGTQQGDTVLACQARVTGDAVLQFDAVPEVRKLAATVSGIRPLSPDIIETTLLLKRDFTYLPGQYVKCKFSGYPSRDYSPTLRTDGTGERNELILQIRRQVGGVVSADLGTRIRPGHKVTVQGPYGSAFHRVDTGRIILIAAGTGWAPIWAIARAARYREPSREMIVIVGARDPRNLYMAESLAWLAETGVARIMPTSSGGKAAGILSGRPTDHMPALRTDDTVYVAGSFEMVAAVQARCEAAGTTCHADPFVASVAKRTIRDRIAGFFFARAVNWPKTAQTQSTENLRP